MKHLVRRHAYVVSLLILNVQLLFSQAELKIGSGEIDSLKNITVIGITYDYSYIGVGTFPNEQEWFAEKKTNMDEAKYEEFAHDWNAARKKRYEPTFEREFSEMIAKIGVTAKNYSENEKVILKVITTYIEPGFQVGMVKRTGHVNFKFVFQDKHGDSIIRFSLENVPAKAPSSYDTHLYSRINNAYAKAAKILAKDLVSRLK